MVKHKVFHLFSLLVILFAVKHGAGQNECQEVLSCGLHGVPVKFPFKLRGSKLPDHCSYPGFLLSCTDEKKTVLELPDVSTTARLYVQRIDYKNQILQLGDPRSCFLRQIPKLSRSSISPFQLESSLINVTFFNCSSSSTNDRGIINGFNMAICPIYPVRSSADLSWFPALTSCTKWTDIYYSSDDILTDGGDFLRLQWMKPDCRRCESKGHECKLSDGNEEATECYSKLKGKPTMLIALSVGLGSSLLVITVISIWYYKSYRDSKEFELRIEKFLQDYRALKPTRYSYADIKRITNHFKDALGQGAYGVVFKGKLSDEVIVAVKVLNDSKGNGEEFINEVGTMGKIHHVNVVRLVGFCADGFRRALVYEFLPNESLEKFICSPDMKNHFLGWEKLHDIALGIARGIEYLHQGCDQQILHFDIKPHNILLDEKFNPKISDFGLAKLCSKDQSAVSMTTARGTIGYIAPEVFSRNYGKVSFKSDVYSFGILLLEMVGGKKNFDTTVENGTQIYFPSWIYNLLEEGEDFRIYIQEQKDAQIAKKLAIVGLGCIQWHPMDRPSMKTVLQMLEGDGDNLSMPPNPFTSTNTCSDAGFPRRRGHQELEVIPEQG